MPDVPQGERRRGNCPGGCECQVFFVVIGCSSAPKIPVEAHNVCCAGILRGDKVQRPVGGAPQFTKRCLETALSRGVLTYRSEDAGLGGKRRTDRLGAHWRRQRALPSRRKVR